MTFCNACGRDVPEDQIADRNLVDTGGDTICLACHLEILPEDEPEYDEFDEPPVSEDEECYE